MKYKRKAQTVDAVQWKKKGDHPDVILQTNAGPDFCRHCGKLKKKHGHVVDVGRVCPGQWVVKGVENRIAIMSDEQLKADFQKA